MPYVYRHIRLDTNEPFYIGIGLKDDNYDRAYSKDSRRSQHWRSIIKSTLYRIDIMFEDDNVDFIKEKEKEFIKLYGRRDLGLGTLVNFTDGGDGSVGYVPSEEQKKKLSDRMKGKNNPMFGRNFSQEHRKKLGEASKGRIYTEEQKKKLSESKIGDRNPMFGKDFSEEHRRKISQAGFGRKQSEETKQKRRESMSKILHPMLGKRGELSPNWGRKATKEQRENISKGKKGKPSPNRKKVIDILTNKIYAYSGDALLDLGLSTTEVHLRSMLKGTYNNWTSLVYLDYYNSTENKATLKAGNNVNPNNKIILDRSSGLFFESVREAYETLNIKYTIWYFTSMLSGRNTNKTSCTYV